MKDYNHKDIEKKWQKKWEDEQLFKTAENPKNPYYTLVEFPYPSGNLHVGHWYAFAVTDIFARYMHHVGKDVLFPFGFDSFGLPAENAAIKRGLNPKTWTYSNIEHMIVQTKNMGTMIDWDTKLITSDPEYYKWTQWLFLQFHKNGLVNHQESHVNWCPSCKTILANEQLEGGVCERCGSIVEQKEMKQWNIEITKYADRLIDDLEPLDWPHHIKEAQKNWIGRSHGTFFTFDIKNVEQKIKVFTTRPDTFMGVTYVVIAPEHELVQTLRSNITNWDEVTTYINKTKTKTDLERQTNKDKSGVILEGIKAIHPATGAEIAVCISDYVIASYGTGCVMAVPAHDDRDFEFAIKYNLPITHVIQAVRIDQNNKPQEGKKDIKRATIHALIKHPSENKYLCLKWKQFNWNTFIVGGVEEGEDMIEAAKREIYEETGYKNITFIKKLAQPVESHYFAAHKDENRTAIATPLLFQLENEDKDQISDEETAKHEPYWSTIDEIKKGPFTCSELDIWIKSLEQGEGAITEEGILINSAEFDGLTSQEAKSAITSKYGEKTTTYKLQDWSVSRQRYWGCPIPMIHCAICGTIPVPEEQLPVVLPEMEKIEMRDDGKSPLAHNTEWMNVACPKCGGKAERETDTLDTFVDSSWYYTRYLDPRNSQEIASKDKMSTWLPIDFYSGGSEHTTRHLLYARFVYKAMHDFGIVPNSEPFIKRNNRGLILGPDGQKMSKSKGNVVDPDILVEQVGADVVRSYLAFMGPYGEAGSYPWDPNGVVGIRRFYERVVELAEKAGDTDSDESLVAINTLLSTITIDLSQFKFNTALSKLMICVNVLEKTSFSKDTFKKFLILCNLYAPHLAQELWEQVGESDFVYNHPFPQADMSILASQKIKIAVQINGKTRAILEIEPTLNKDEILSLAKAHSEVSRWMGDKTITKEIYVPSKLVSFVLEN